MRHFTARSIRTFVEQWYAALDRHDDLDEVKKFVVDAGLEMRFPEGTFRGHSGFAEWYKAVCHRFFDEEHKVTDVHAVIDGTDARVQVHVNWQARVWNPPAARSEWLGFDAEQTWVVVAGDTRAVPLIKTYICDALEPMSGSAAL
ncbi:nuclear transport factor 2 family protein [Streptomyces sp. NPDC007095]|uniref:nuclear transport factor 2 family protein n=1 Tax=Streptomyces sp. NPDC007095 TaxID=3154482 RepID=UPI0033FD6019